MAIALIDSVLAQTTDFHVVTTAAINTTGANLLVIVAVGETNFAAMDVSDSKSNTWTPLTAQVNATTSKGVRIWYSGGSPTVGSGHTFTAGTAVGDPFFFPSIVALAFSGAAASSFFDQESAGDEQNAGTATIQPGSLTPAADNELLITGMNQQGGGTSSTINSSFSIAEQIGEGDGDGLAVAYQIQTTATARNPTWTADGGSAIATVMAAWKAAAVVGTRRLAALGVG